MTTSIHFDIFFLTKSKRSHGFVYDEKNATQTKGRKLGKRSISHVYSPAKTFTLSSKPYICPLTKPIHPSEPYILSLESNKPGFGKKSLDELMPMKTSHVGFWEFGDIIYSFYLQLKTKKNQAMIPWDSTLTKSRPAYVQLGLNILHRGVNTKWTKKMTTVKKKKKYNMYGLLFCATYNK